MAYKQSDKVNGYEKEYVDYINNNKPSEFSSENTKKANDALKAYEDRGEFKYNPATDSGYQAARKQYTSGGKQAMKDTLGTAAELTGGYDNSYAQVAAQQQYNSYMSQLASLMPQYEQQAYDRYQDEGQQMIDYYSILKQAESNDYNMYRDKVSDYYTEADLLYGQYSDEKNFDYGSYVDQRDFDEGVRQYNENLAEEQRQYDTNAAISQTNANADYLSALADYNESLEGEADSLYTYSGLDDDGKAVYYKDGKKYTFTAGLNPYTGTTNADVAAGAKTFKNGYQPKQILMRNEKGDVVYKNGSPVFLNLEDTDYTSDDNGVTQTVWKTTGRDRGSRDVKYWLWNGKTNSYEEVEKPGE